MRVGLKQNNLEAGDDWLMGVSHPDSPDYGKFWSSDKVIESFKPSDETVTAVRDWLINVGGIHDARITHSDNKAWLAFDATTEEAERLLRTEYHEYEHSSTGHVYAACDEYHVPKEIQSHIDFITPGVKGTQIGRTLKKRAHVNNKHWKPSPIPMPHPAPFMPKFDNALDTCDVAITPACLRALYGFEPQDPHRKVNPSNSLGIFESGDFYSQLDLNLFFTNFTHGEYQIPNGTHPILNSIGKWSIVFHDQLLAVSKGFQMVETLLSLLALLVVSLTWISSLHSLSSTLKTSPSTRLTTPTTVREAVMPLVSSTPSSTPLMDLTVPTVLMVSAATTRP